MKDTFIQDEIWILVFGGAFQRANIYKENISESERKNFRFKLKSYVENVFLENYKKPVSEEQHIENIKELSLYSSSFQDILNNRRINFGVSQKLLNLYLKYQWCLGNVNEPPHFPVDRIIQQKLRCKEITAWTRMQNEKAYLAVINTAKEKARELDLSLPELELQIFQRRN